MKALIVGAGISGLSALSVFRRAGIDAECVDRSAQVSGVWVHAPDFFNLQTATEAFTYPGRPYPPGTSKQATRKEIIEYWESLVTDFELQKFIRLQIEVVKAVRKDGGWEVSLRSSKEGDDREDVEILFYDFLVVASGLYGREELACAPKGITESEEFPGRIMHNTGIERNWTPKSGESVAVVGFGATALGLLRHYATLDPSVEVHHVFRNPRWWVPQRILGVLPWELIFFARFVLMFVSSWFYGTDSEKKLHASYASLVSFVWKAVEWLCTVSSRAPKDLVPEEDLEDWLRASVVIMPRNYFGNVRSGRIKTHRGSIACMTKKRELVLSSGECFRVDNVILCTGYQFDTQKWLDEGVRQQLSRSDGLYRHVVLPGVDNLGFVGFNQGFSTTLCSYLGACWLVAVIKGLIRVPKPIEMHKEISRVAKFKRDHIAKESHMKHVTAARYLSHCDELLVDMSMDPSLGKSTLSWLFCQWVPDLYAGVLDELLARSQKIV